ncbi:MAG: hypothetical protein NT069_23835 [Planctomycetota bacterium]|nr:hypothetical protein [Planctomycetota bacterium]
MSHTKAEPAVDDCMLPLAQQRRNSLCYAGFWCLFYFAAPVTYVGTMHANLLKALDCSDTVANLPHAFYQWCTACPILLAWFFPQPKLLKPLLVTALVAMATVAALVALALVTGASANVVTGTVLLFSAVFGAANGTVFTAMWEVVRRGTSTALRGRTMGLAFGFGPIFACVGSVMQQMLMDREPLTQLSFDLDFPMNYFALFAGAVPLFALAALLGSMFTVPIAEEEEEPGRLQNAIHGLKQFFTYPPVLFASIGYLVVYSGGNAILENVSLYAKEVLNKQIGDTQGIQGFLRFSFKSVAGMGLGWLLSKSNPKMTLLATTGILLFGMGWALNSSGYWYLLTFGLLGAGELFGAYFPNYVATASSKSSVRANIALLNLLGSFVGFASVFYGWLADRSGRVATFYAAATLLIVALAFLILCLPPKPIPAPEPSQGSGP